VVLQRDTLQTISFASNSSGHWRALITIGDVNYFCVVLTIIFIF